MPFENFTNPFQNPHSVPDVYRNHSTLRQLFRADGSGRYVRPAEDPVTLWAIDILVKEYGIPLDALQLELQADYSEGSHREGSGSRILARPDVIVYDDRYSDSIGNLDVAFIVVEVIAPTTKKGDQNWAYHLKKLNAYMGGSSSARYAILTNGIQTDIYRRDLDYPRKLEPIGDLPKYESAREAAKHSPYTVILNPDQPDGIQTGLTPLTRDKFREVLGDTRSGCHSILRDNEGLQPQEAVDAMVKFLFAKWYDEQATVDLAKKTGEARAYVFSLSAETDPNRLVLQVKDALEKAKEWEQETLKRKFGEDLGVRVAFSDADILQFKPHTTVEIVKRLQPWSLRRSSADIKGGVFEDFLSKTFRDDLGQYFTPTPVINLMVGMLQPTVNDYVGDPACGSARMLTHVLDYVRKKEYAKAVNANNGITTGINPEEPTEDFIKFRDNHLFGAEISRNVMHVARVNTLMNGAQYADLKIINSLERMSSITSGIAQGLPTDPGFYPGGLTMILTNPPFGSILNNSRVLEDFAASDGVSKRNGIVVKAVPQEVAFINRCLEFLAPGGKLAIVLPDGILANNSMQFVRDWVLRWARLKSIISLPPPTFAPYGAGVKTSVVVLEKREIPLSSSTTTIPNNKTNKRKKIDKSMQLPLDQFVEDINIANSAASVPNSTGNLEFKDDYDVYMALIDDIGYDATGRLSVPEEEAPFPPEVRDTIEDFDRMVGWK